MACLPTSRPCVPPSPLCRAGGQVCNPQAVPLRPPKYVDKHVKLDLSMQEGGRQRMVTDMMDN